MSRRTLLVLLLGALLGLGLWWLWPARQDFVNLPPSARGSWVAFGDSLTEGYGASDNQSYPAQLARRLGVEILNKGISGHTTDDGLKRLDEILALKPRVVLLCLGGNDALQHTPPSVTFSNLAVMIQEFHEHGAFVVLIGVRSASLRDRNAAHFDKLARERRVLLVPDILKGIAFRPIYMSDALHPNDVGYGKIAERLEEVLRPLLPRLCGHPPAE